MLRTNIEKIYEREPEWMRTKIKNDLQTRGVEIGRPLTSREVDTAMWRNYRMEIPQVKALFGADIMSQLVKACFGPEGESHKIPATG